MRFVFVIIKTCLNTNDGLDCIHRNQPYEIMFIIFVVRVNFH